jgi:TRAP-type C4-dicarboxylate transport system permease small subunit
VKVTRFERRHENLAPVPVFIKRLVASIGMAVLLIAFVLFVGIAGYHWLAGFDWVDSLLEASMILGGMGPVSQLPSTAAKVFASIYALFSGLLFIGIMGIVLAPVVHRMLHKFHVDEKDLKKTK